MTREERIINHKCTNLDYFMADTAWKIVKAYSGSFKSNLIPFDTICCHYVKYCEDIGFALCESKAGSTSVVLIKINLDTFVEAVVSYLGDCNITWEKIKENEAVKKIYP